MMFTTLNPKPCLWPLERPSPAASASTGALLLSPPGPSPLHGFLGFGGIGFWRFWGYAGLRVFSPSHLARTSPRCRVGSEQPVDYRLRVFSLPLSKASGLGLGV